MISPRALHAARARLAVARHDGAVADERGFAMVLVLIVTLMVMGAMAVAFATVIPNATDTTNDQHRKAALSAAYAGVQDFVALASSTNGCRTTACARILNHFNDGTIVPSGGASAGSPTPTVISNTGGNEEFTWWTEPSPTPNYYVRVHATGYWGCPSGRITGCLATHTLTADVGLTNPFLAFGYYSDYETQSSNYIDTAFGAHKIYIPNYASNINAQGTDSSGKSSTMSVTGKPTVSWTAPGVNALADSVCNQHWYRETLPNGTTVPGRASFPNQSQWGQQGTLSGYTVASNKSCDVNFTTGITFDGPLYTRDALLVSDGTSGGAGPNFKQPVSTLWGSANYNNPAPSDPTQPWRQNSQVGGAINTAGSYKPSNTGVQDLRLPTSVATGDLPDNACIYTGPTRVVLNNGVATITSPMTTARAATSDPNCYPAPMSTGASVSTGIVGFQLNYATVGNGTIVVKNVGTPLTSPPSGKVYNTTAYCGPSSTATACYWPATNQSSTSTPTASDTAFYIGGASSTPTPDASTSAAPDSGCSSASYSANVNQTCAWTNVKSVNDGGGWTAYTSTGTGATCDKFVTTGTAATNPSAADRRMFECEYSQATSGSPSKTYATFRAAIQTAIASSACTNAAASDPASCQAVVQTEVNKANTGGAATVTAALGAHRYVVTASTGSSSAGTTQSVGSAGTGPLTSDSLFTTTGTPGTEKSTYQPITLAVTRQVYACYNTASPYAYVPYTTKCPTGSALGWGNGSNGNSASTPQFSTTVTNTSWAIQTNATAASYFPNMNDVTQYNMPVSSTQAPGDLYVQGQNQGTLSLVADNDAIVTGDLVDTSANVNNDAVDIVAGNNVRNYHPVSCVDTTAADFPPTSSLTPGWCPNDLSGLYSGYLTNSDGSFQAQHPAAQYQNMTSFSSTNPAANCPLSNNSTSTAPSNCREIDAAIFALGGSFLTDNYNRGLPLGSVAIDGGLYQSHRGTNGIQWEYKSGDPKRASSGANLQYHYINLQHRGLPFTPASTSGQSTRPWQVVSISDGGNGS